MTVVFLIWIIIFITLFNQIKRVINATHQCYYGIYAKKDVGFYIRNSICDNWVQVDSIRGNNPFDSILSIFKGSKYCFYDDADDKFACPGPGNTLQRCPLQILPNNTMPYCVSQMFLSRSRNSIKVEVIPVERGVTNIIFAIIKDNLCIYGVETGASHFDEFTKRLYSNCSVKHVFQNRFSHTGTFSINNTKVVGIFFINRGNLTVASYIHNFKDTPFSFCYPPDDIQTVDISKETSTVKVVPVESNNSKCKGNSLTYIKYIANDVFSIKTQGLSFRLGDIVLCRKYCFDIFIRNINSTSYGKFHKCLSEDQTIDPPTNIVISAVPNMADQINITMKVTWSKPQTTNNTHCDILGYIINVTKQNTVIEYRMVPLNVYKLTNLELCDQFCLKVLSKTNEVESKWSSLICAIATKEQKTSGIEHVESYLSEKRLFILRTNLPKLCFYEKYEVVLTNQFINEDTVIQSSVRRVLYDKLIVNTLYSVKFRLVSSRKQKKKIFPYSESQRFYTGQKIPEIYGYLGPTMSRDNYVVFSFDIQPTSQKATFMFIGELAERTKCQAALLFNCTNCGSFLNEGSMIDEGLEDLSRIIACRDGILKKLKFNSTQSKFIMGLGTTNPISKKASFRLYGANILGVHKIVGVNMDKPKKVRLKIPAYLKILVGVLLSTFIVVLLLLLWVILLRKGVLRIDRLDKHVPKEGLLRDMYVRIQEIQPDNQDIIITEFYFDKNTGGIRKRATSSKSSNRINESVLAKFRKTHRGSINLDLEEKSISDEILLYKPKDVVKWGETDVMQAKIHRQPKSVTKTIEYFQVK